LQKIFWINGDRPPHLAIVMRPRGDDLLEKELWKMKRGGIDTLVSLLEPLEADWLGLEYESTFARAAGLKFLNYPIRDRQVPGDIVGFAKFIENIAERLSRGERVGVHCRGCIGRATIATACVLIHLGWKPAQALRAIEGARGAAVPDTQEQHEWILSYGVRP
jgi:protein-tyrosine phosphatase